MERIDRLNPRLNAFLTVTHDLARQSAREAEGRAMHGELRGAARRYSILDQRSRAGSRCAYDVRIEVVRAPRPNRGRRPGRTTAVDGDGSAGQDQHRPTL